MIDRVYGIYECLCDFLLNIWVYLSDRLAVVRAIIVHVLCRRMLISIDVFFYVVPLFYYLGYVFAGIVKLRDSSGYRSGLGRLLFLLLYSYEDISKSVLQCLTLVIFESCILI